MKSFPHLVRIIDMKRYDTDTATLLASKGLCFLYKTLNGAYFACSFHQAIMSGGWTGWRFKLLSAEAAAKFYLEEFLEHSVPFETAFPSITITNA